jgi:hypothetical protein
MALVEPLPPTLTLSSPTTIQFNQSSINNILNISHVIRSLGGSVATATLEWRRNNTGSWNFLSDNASSSFTFLHTLTDPEAFSGATNSNGTDVKPFNYRYTATDSIGGTSSIFLNITPQLYVAPSFSYSVVGANLATPETNLERERGNVSTNISGSITRQSSLVNLVSYQLQYQVNNNGVWLDFGPTVNTGQSSATIPTTNHNPISDNTASTIAYRVSYRDTYQVYRSSSITSSVNTINYRLMIYHGHRSSTPTTSTDVRTLTATGGRLFVTGSNPFILNTGNTNRFFVAAMPNTNSITLVTDLDSLGANITNDYINTPFNVNDAGGTSLLYKVYTMEIAGPYSSNKRHQITRT